MTIGFRIGAIAVLAAIALPQAQRQPLTPASFERVVAPFVVLNDRGEPYALPFLGGLDVPRPMFVDIDGDGDLDLFLQEYRNSLMFFENMGTPLRQGFGGQATTTPRYTWRSDRYQDLDIGEWYRFVDLDNDGDIDLVCELPFSHIRHYRNTGTKTQPHFEDAGTLKDSDGQDIFLDRQNIPAFTDVDCDGRLDLFVGRVEGTVARFEAEKPGGDRFTFLTEQWEGIEIIGRGGGDRVHGPATTPSFHGANALAFADFDADGDQDLFWGDFFEPGMLLIENIGRTCSTPSFQVEPVQLPFATDTKTTGYNAPAPVDLDRDGDLDFLMGVLGGAFNAIASGADNFYYWERTAKDKFEVRSKRFLDGIDVGSESVPTLADIDADGDLDVLVGNKIDPAKGDAGRLFIFTNDGTRTAPKYRLKDTLRMADAYNLAPALGDLDGDGDLDMLLGTWNTDILFFRNTGTAREPHWVQDTAATIRPPRVTFATPVLADIDGDKDLDLILGRSNGAIVFYRNTGTTLRQGSGGQAPWPRFTLVSDALDNISAGRRSAPALVDLDADGKLDLVVGREDGGVTVYRNAGSPTAPHFVEDKSFTLPLPPMSSPVFADVDGDGAIDLVSGSVSGGLVFYRGRGR